jgi:hypothetical protein
MTPAQYNEYQRQADVIEEEKKRLSELSKQEISDEEIEKAANGHFEGDLMWSERIAFKLAIKWYREQLKCKGSDKKD